MRLRAMPLAPPSCRLPVQLDRGNPFVAGRFPRNRRRRAVFRQTMTRPAPVQAGPVLSRWAAVLLLAAGGCAGETEVVDSPFTATGELIALSGGDGGPANACFTCHGLDGGGDGQLTPALAGLPEGYLVKQLQDYADGRRPDPVMGPIARRLSTGHRRAVAAWYSAMPPTAFARTAAPATIRALYHRGDPAGGLAACADCHGGLGQGLGPANPPLAGQPPAYLAEQMRRWKQAGRRNDPRGVMLQISQRLTEDEITALAGYAAGLRPPDEASS